GLLGWFHHAAGRPSSGRSLLRRGAVPGAVPGGRRCAVPGAAPASALPGPGSAQGARNRKEKAVSTRRENGTIDTDFSLPTSLRWHYPGQVQRVQAVAPVLSPAGAPLVAVKRLGCLLECIKFGGAMSIGSIGLGDAAAPLTREIGPRKIAPLPRPTCPPFLPAKPMKTTKGSCCASSTPQRRHRR